MRTEAVINKGYRDVNTVQFGYEACEKSHHYGPAIRTHWLLHYVASGRGYFRIEGREYHPSAGDIFVIPPFVETYYEADARDPWEYIWVGFTVGEGTECPFEDVMRPKGAGLIFEEMKQCGKLSRGRTEFLCGKVWQLLALIMDGAAREPSPVEQALSLIHAEYMTGITVGRMADIIGLERTYFSALFKREVGVPPMEYLLNYRMERAAELLRAGSSVGVTALSVGYSDVYIFSKMFKKRFGQPPSKYAAR